MYIINTILVLSLIVFNTQGPHSYILITGEGGGGGPSDFFGSEILAKSDFFGSMKHAEIFLDHEKKQRDFFGLQNKD